MLCTLIDVQEGLVARTYSRDKNRIDLTHKKMRRGHVLSLKVIKLDSLNLGVYTGTGNRLYSLQGGHCKDVTVGRAAVLNACRVGAKTHPLV